MTRCPQTYQEGTVFGLQQLAPIGFYRLYSNQGVTMVPLHLTDYHDVAPLYPRGLSPHGIRYLLFPPHQGSHAIERELEQCRRQFSPNQPSRYESYFSWPTEHDARQWMADQVGRGFSCTLLRVEAETAIPRQQEMVNHFAAYRAQGIDACHFYWQEKPQGGRIELQMPGPITVTEVIEQGPR